MEALEYWLNTGAKPKRTFYIAFGHDEEVNKGGGASANLFIHALGEFSISFSSAFERY
jgi:acetylornithine deacetylase/succinyl-diaminopimelate desuccinylase-like protein